MSAPLDRDTLREMLPAYAIGALEPDERRTVDDALMQYPELRAEVDAYLSVSDALLTAVPHMEPRPELRDAIMQSISEQPSNRPSIIRYGLLAAAMFIIIAGVVFVLTRSDDSSGSVIASIMDDSDSRRFEFEGAENFETVSGALIVAPDARQGVLWVQNLDVLDETQAYQLWLARGEDQRISGLVFQPDESETWQLVDLPADFSEYVGFGVTIEPAGGSDGPTSPPVFLGSLENE